MESRTVWKFHTPLAGRFTLSLPRNHRFLMFAPQGTSENDLYAWFELRPGDNVGEAEFAVIGTGHPVPHASKHLGSCQQDNFVWHLYELIGGEINA